MGNSPHKKSEDSLDEVFGPVPGKKIIFEPNQKAILTKILFGIRGFPRNLDTAMEFIRDTEMAFQKMQDLRSGRPAKTMTDFQRLQKTNQYIDYLQDLISPLLSDELGTLINSNSEFRNYKIDGKWKRKHSTIHGLSMYLIAIKKPLQKTCDQLSKNSGPKKGGLRSSFINEVVMLYEYHVGTLPPRSRRSNFHQYLSNFLSMAEEEQTDCSRLIMAAVDSQADPGP